MAWTTQPGSYDTVHARQIFTTDNTYHIPALQHVPLARFPRWLAPYRARIRSTKPLDDGAVHFFLDDYRFETVWTTPHKALRALQPFQVLLTPGFSLYTDWPLAIQIWNTYRNRWCGAFWQAQGRSVIPTVVWSTPESYDFCFCGVPQHSMVAITTIGLAKNPPIAHQYFRQGFEEMVKRLQPSTVLCYGKLLDNTLNDLVTIVTYPTRWDNIRAARRGAHQQPRGR